MIKKIISIALLLTIILTGTISTSLTVNATEIENYGIDENDIYIPDLPSNIEPEIGIESSYDPRIPGRTTPVKNQRNQGTCSVFASIAIMEEKAYLETGVKNSFSEEAAKFLTSSALRMETIKR